MSYHYGSSSSSSSSSTPSSARQTTVNAQGLVAPPGFHYMPDGTLMSDIDHARTYGSGGTIKTFDLDTTNIKASGEKREFTVTGDGTFSLMIKNESNNYYNFTTNKFQTANTRLANKKIKNTYRGIIRFPSAPTTTDVVNGAVNSGVKVVMDNNVATKMEVGDRVTGNAALNAANVTVAALDPDGNNAKEFSMSEEIAIANDAVLTFTGSDQYDVFLFAENGTSHADYNEFRFADNTIDINSSTGSDSLLIRKVIYQTLNMRLTFSGAIADGSSGAGFSGFSNSNRKIISAQIGASTGKIPFSFDVEAGSTHSFTVDRNPTINDVFIKSTRTIGIEAPIEGEDVSGGHYRWSIDNLYGVTAGMIPIGTNITAGSTVSSYEEVVTSLAGYEAENRIVKVRKEAVENIGAPTLTRDTGTKAVTTVQAGNIVFNKQQAGSLRNDEISIVGFGQDSIKSLTGWDIELTDMIVTLTKPTSLVSSTTINSTTVTVANADGIMDDVTTVSGFNIDSSVAEPTVTNIASYTGSTATLTLSSAQSLEAGETLTFNNAARKITISGNFRVISAGSNPAYWDGILGFDLEKFITATDES
mgnify:CR=1 FL=1